MTRAELRRVASEGRRRWRPTAEHPLRGQMCPCENAACPHHDIDAGRGCPSHAEGDVVGRDPIMMFLGPCCRPCAEAMVASGGAEYVLVPIGTAGAYEG